MNIITINYHTAYEAKVNHHASLYAINNGDEHDNIVRSFVQYYFFYKINL